MRKSAGDADTLYGNIVSALVPYGTVNKANARGEGTQGILARHALQMSGGWTGGAVVGASAVRALDALAGRIKAGKLKAVLEALTRGIPAIGTAYVTGAVPGQVVGDRIADYIL